MLNSIQVLSGVDLMTGAFAVSVFVAGAALAMLIVFGVFAFRRAGQTGASGALWRGALVLIGAVVAWALLDRASLREYAAERRAIEARAAELTARAIAPGSALACLDAVASAPVETACEKALFATPEAVAAAVAYVDARFSLLVASVKPADRDPSYAPSLQRLRRAIEADRFGLVAHVLMTRGCNAADCPDLKLLRNTGRILANMKARTFDALVGAHAVAWHPSGAGVAAVSSPPLVAATPLVGATPPVAAMPPVATTGAASSVAVPSRFDFPSAASIPPVSIMNAEPVLPQAAEPQPEPRASPPPRRSQAQPARRQPAREQAAPAQPPLSVVPQGATPAPPQTFGAR